MAFILAADGRDEDVIGRFERYRAYLHSVRDAFPPSAFALAMSAPLLPQAGEGARTIASPIHLST